MIKGNEEFSESARIFYQLLEDNSPDLLKFATVESPSEENPYIVEEPNSILIVIPAKEGSPLGELHAETRKEDILIGVTGAKWHVHVSWWSEEVIEKQMLYAIRLINDILNERVVFAKRISLFSREEYFDNIRTEELSKKKRLLAVYSWNGTLSIEYGTKKEARENIIKWAFRGIFVLMIIILCLGCVATLR